MSRSTLESGLITGLAGQVGSGTSTILRALGGLVPNASGTVEVRGREGSAEHAAAGRRRGRAVHPERPAARRALPRPDGRAQPDGRAAAPAEPARRSAAPPDPAHCAGARRDDRRRRRQARLSGREPQRRQPAEGAPRPRLELEGTALLALDEPTRGVDVGGRADIHNLVREAARNGTAVIFSSTELDEVLDLADVVVTIFHGRIVSVVPRAEASASAILADMTTSHGSSTGAAS